ncbi:hypothetical protein V1519DRAFT_77699 [Lipomyces tetrasporus]
MSTTSTAQLAARPCLRSFSQCRLHTPACSSLLRTTARQRFGDLAADRVKGIWAGVQDNAWIARFLARPNAYVEDVDVLITTSVLQAGHSLDRYFSVSFDFLFRGVLSFREELRFTSRLRYIGRAHMAEYKFCWIPAGGADSKRAGKRRLQFDIEQAWNPKSGARWGAEFVNTIKTIYVPLKSEQADTFNRGYWLHKTEFRLSQVQIVELDEKALIGELEDEGITVQIVTEFTKTFASSSIKRWWLTFDENYADDFMELIDEIGNVAESHMKSVGTLADNVKDAQTERDLAACLASDGSNLPTTPSSVHGTMSSFVDLVAILDLACARRGDGGDDKRFWKRRKLSSYPPSHQDRVSIVEYCLDL